MCLSYVVTTTVVAVVYSNIVDNDILTDITTRPPTRTGLHRTGLHCHNKNESPSRA